MVLKMFLRCFFDGLYKSICDGFRKFVLEMLPHLLVARPFILEVLLEAQLFSWFQGGPVFARKEDLLVARVFKGAMLIFGSLDLAFS